MEYKMEYVVTPYLLDEIKTLMKSGFKIINKEKLIDLIFSKSNTETKSIYVTLDSDDSFYLNLLIDKATKIVVLSTVIFENLNLKPQIKYSTLKNVDLYHLPDNISVDRITNSINIILDSMLDKINKLAIICPAQIKNTLRRKSGKYYFVEKASEITKDTDFVVDTMINDKFEYITLGEAIARVYGYSVIVSQSKGVFYRLMSESSFTKLYTGKNISMFEQYIPILKYKHDSLSVYYNDVLFNNLIAIDSVIGYNCNLFSTVIHAKLNTKNYKMNLICSIVSTVINNSDYAYNFIDFNLTHEDHNFDIQNRIAINKYLYSIYGESTSLLFYINIISEYISGTFDDKGFIDKPTLLRIKTQVDYLISLGKYNRAKVGENIPKIEYKSEEYQQIRSLILSLYKNVFIKYEQSKYVDLEGNVFSISDDRTIHNWDKLLPEKIIPLVIKDKFIYVWETVE